MRREIISACRHQQKKQIFLKEEILKNWAFGEVAKNPPKILGCKARRANSKKTACLCNQTKSCEIFGFKINFFKYPQNGHVPF